MTSISAKGDGSDGCQTFSTAGTLPVLRLEIPNASVDPLLAALVEASLSACAWQEAGKPLSQVRLYLDDPGAFETVLSLLRGALSAVGLPSTRPVLERLRREDWTESWKRFFHARRVSDRIVIRPPWEPYARRSGDIVVTIDPGMSFGTGQHDTTRHCLIFLDCLAVAGVRGAMRDLGCGSGILSIAAARLGFAPVRGLDNDPVAVQTAREQARLNDLEADVRFAVADLKTVDPAAPPAMVVAANILAPVLIAHADAISASVAEDGWLLLAGILRKQYAAVRHAYRERGFRETDSRAGPEWQSGCFRAGLKSGRSMQSGEGVSAAPQTPRYNRLKM